MTQICQNQHLCMHGTEYRYGYAVNIHLPLHVQIEALIVDAAPIWTVILG
jgi:hypothetical protein